MEKIWSNVNGKVVDYTAQLAISPVTNTPEAGINNDTESADEFSFATGDMNDNSEFSLASGKKKKKKSGGRKRRGGGGFVGDFLSRAQDNRASKIKMKMMEAKAQQISAKGLADSTQGDIAMANALAASAPKSTSESEGKGMSKGMKIGLIVAGVVVLGIIAFIVVKKMKAKKAGGATPKLATT